MKKFLLGLTTTLSALLSGCSESSSIGIIGGADGPTSILVASKLNWWSIIGIIAGITIIAVGAILFFKRKNK